MEYHLPGNAGEIWEIASRARKNAEGRMIGRKIYYLCLTLLPCVLLNQEEVFMYNLPQ